MVQTYRRTEIGKLLYRLRKKDEKLIEIDGI